MACTSFYSAVASNPTVTGDETAWRGISGAWIIGVANTWASNLRKIPTLDGSKAIPDIIKGSAQISVLIPPTGYLDGGQPLTTMSYTGHVDVCINGSQYNNTFYTGGAVKTQDLGEGLKTLQLTKRFTIFGIAPTATA